ncbi:MAG: LppX LprAFG lipoprotein [Marmoricola sp.]|nr:LppX LprAFG lipoprotein [Marmoricola sp.]
MTATVAALLALGAAACGGPGSDPGTLGVPLYSQTPLAGVTGTAGIGTDPTRLLTTLAANMEAKGSAHVDEQTPTELVSGTFSANSSGTDVAVTISVPGTQLQNLQVIAVGGATYVSLSQVTGAGKFAQIQATDTTLGPLLASLQTIRPGTTFSKVAPAVTKVRDLGPVTVGGDKTEHFLLLIDSLQSHQLLNPNVQLSPESAAKLPKTFRYNLYVKDGLVRRVQFVLLGKATTLDYTHWGSSSHISAPPASALVATPAGL